MNRPDAAIHDASMEVARCLRDLVDTVVHGHKVGNTIGMHEAELNLGWALRDYASAIRNGRPFPRPQELKR